MALFSKPVEGFKEIASTLVGMVGVYVSAMTLDPHVLAQVLDAIVYIVGMLIGGRSGFKAVQAVAESMKEGAKAKAIKAAAEAAPKP